MQGCLFHLSQSIYRHVQQENLQNWYVTDLSALAFLPPNKIKRSYVQLKDLFDNEAAGLLHKLSTADTNAVEAWHSRFAKLIGVKHIGIFKMLIALQREQADTENIIERIIAGEPRPSSKKAKERKVRLGN
uniref:MULE transposase domain-containing protein n=1 Tax=Strigamia maritima TaxID=126957 RepID=T1J7J1_STRMM